MKMTKAEAMRHAEELDKAVALGYWPRMRKPMEAAAKFLRDAVEAKPCGCGFLNGKSIYVYESQLEGE